MRNRIVIINVLRKLSYNKGYIWASPMLTQPKKTEDIKILTDFKRLNKYIERKPFPLLMKCSYTKAQ